MSGARGRPPRRSVIVSPPRGPRERPPGRSVLVRADVLNIFRRCPQDAGDTLVASQSRSFRSAHYNSAVFSVRVGLFQNIRPMSAQTVNTVHSGVPWVATPRHVIGEHDKLRCFLSTSAYSPLFSRCPFEGLPGSQIQGVWSESSQSPEVRLG